MKLTHLAAAAVIAATSAFTAQAEELKLSHIRPEGAQVDTDIRAFTKAVTEATGGDLTFRIYPASALGDYTTVQERISLGAVQMAIQPGSASVDRRMQISYLPYLAQDYPHARKLYGEGGVVRNAIGEILGAQGIMLLAAYPVYFGGISLNTDAPEPGAKNGIKVRVPGVKSFQMLADNLGYIGSPIPFSEAYTSVQTGVVDGVIGSGAEGYYASFKDVTKSFIRANTHFETWYLMINTDSFNGLSADQQAALKTAAQAFEMSRWAAAEEDQVKNEAKLAELGASIQILDEAQLSAMAAKVRENVWPAISEDLGADWMGGILEAAAATAK